MPRLGSRVRVSFSAQGKSYMVGIGKVVEWSITAVLKTAVLRGTGGSNPSLSAEKRAAKVARFFLCPKICTQNAPIPFIRIPAGVL